MRKKYLFVRGLQPRGHIAQRFDVVQMDAFC